MEIFATVNLNNIVIGGIAFGINSGAYVAEIFRSGIMSVDKGQTEAGRVYLTIIRGTPSMIQILFFYSVIALV